MARMGRAFPAPITKSHATFSDHLIEDFDTADNASLAAADTDLKWSVGAGAVGIVSNEASSTGAGPNRARAEHLLVSPDMWVEANGTNSLEDVANQNINLSARMNAQPNAALDMYVAQFRFQSDVASFFRTSDGASTAIGSTGAVTLDAGTYYDFRLECTGPPDAVLLRAFVNDVLIVEHTDTTAPGGYDPGLFSGFATQEPSTGTSRITSWEAGTVFVTDITAVLTPGAVVIAGQTLNTSISVVATLTPGAVVIAGQSLNASKTVQLTPGAVVVTGQTLNTSISVVATLTPGAVTIAGQSLNASKSVDLTPGAVVISGQTVQSTFTVPVTPGAVVISGQTLTTSISVVATLTPGAVVISGQSLNANSSSTLTPGAVVISGQTLNTSIAVIATLTPGAVVIAGQALNRVENVPLTPGAVVISGQTLNTSIAVLATLTPGAVVIAGQNLNITKSVQLTPGAVVIAGQSLTTSVAVTATLTPGTLVITGQSLNAVSTIVVQLTPGTLQIQGMTLTTTQTGAGIATPVRGPTWASPQGSPVDTLIGDYPVRATRQDQPVDAVEV